MARVDRLDAGQRLEHADSLEDAVEPVFLEPGVDVVVNGISSEQVAC